MEPHSVVIIGPAAPFRGGISHYNVKLFDALKKLKGNSFYFSFKRMYPKFLYPGKTDKDISKNKFIIPEVNYTIDSLNPFSWIFTAFKIINLKPSVVVFNWWTAFWSLTYLTIIILLKLFLKEVKIIFICHNVYDHERNFIKDFLTNIVLKRVDGFIVHSSVEKEVLEYMFPLKKVHFCKMPLFDVFDDIKENASRLRKEFNISSDAKLILFFGFIRPYKGLDTLFKAIFILKEKIPKIKLLVIGEFMYDLYSKYVKLRKKMNLNSHILLFNKYVPNEEVGKYFKMSDVLVLPYNKATGSAIVSIAYHFNLPVIATNVGSFPEIIIDGKTGYLVNPGDSQMLAQKIFEYFIKNKKNEFQKNIEIYKKEFSWNNVVEKILSFIPKEN